MRRLDEAARAMDAERATRRATSGPPPRPSRPTRRPRSTAELAGGERASSSKKAFQRLRDEDAPSRDDASAAKKHKRRAERDSKDSKSGLEEREERELKLERASPTKTVVVSETKDRYARAVDAALASETDASTDASIGSASVSTDLSALNVLEPVQSGSIPINQASSVPSGFVPAAAAGACDFARCDAAAGPQVFDETCVSLGGLGCIGQTGCRFCKAGAIGEAGLATCPPCVCQAMGVAGCVSGGARRRRPPDGWRRQGGATTATNDFDGGVPVDVASCGRRARGAHHGGRGARLPGRSRAPDEAERRPPRRRRRRRRPAAPAVAGVSALTPRGSRVVRSGARARTCAATTRGSPLRSRISSAWWARRTPSPGGTTSARPCSRTTRVGTACFPCTL